MSTPADRNYSNARRAGRTQPGLIEIIEPRDDRWNGGRVPGQPMPPRKAFGSENRSERRRRGQRGSIDLNQCRRPADRAVA